MLEAFVEIFRKRHERAVLADLEQSAPDTPDHLWPPMPSTVHPAYQSNAAFVRDLMRQGHHRVLLPKPTPIHAFLAMDSNPMVDFTQPTTLTVKRCAAPAPYVGDPYCITWKVAVDDGNRWVASEPETQSLLVM